MPPYLKQLPFFQVRKFIESRLELVVALVHFISRQYNRGAQPTRQRLATNGQGRDQMPQQSLAQHITRNYDLPPTTATAPSLPDRVWMATTLFLFLRLKFGYPWETSP
jgi:hypothetical protein